MGLVKKILYGAVGIGLVIALIVVIVKGFNKGESDVNRGMDQYSSMSNDMQDAEKSYFDGKTVTGQEIIDAINKFKGEYVSIVVKNGKGNTAEYIYSSTTPDTNGITTIPGTGTVDNINTSQASVSTNNYINPNGEFEGKVYKDKNSLIARIEFKQK